MKQAVCVLVFNSEFDVLAVSRRDNHEDFGLPGGKVDEGETLTEAAIREAKEETGYTVFDLVKVFEHTFNPEYHTTTFIANYEPNPSPVDPAEGKVDWIHPFLLCTGTFGDYNAALLNQILSEAEDNRPYDDFL